MKNLASPEITEGLLYYGLVTQEQADEANALWDKEYARLTEESEWWDRLAEIAWHNEVGRLRRWWETGYVPPLWKYRWIRARRGW